MYSVIVTTPFETVNAVENTIDECLEFAKENIAKNSGVVYIGNEYIDMYLMTYRDWTLVSIDYGYYANLLSELIVKG